MTARLIVFGNARTYQEEPVRCLTELRFDIT